LNSQPTVRDNTGAFRLVFPLTESAPESDSGALDGRRRGGLTPSMRSPIGSNQGEEQDGGLPNASFLSFRERWSWKRLRTERVLQRLYYPGNEVAHQSFQRRSLELGGGIATPPFLTPKALHNKAQGRRRRTLGIGRSAPSVPQRGSTI